MDKGTRRKQAMKRDKRNKRILVALCGIAIVAVIVLFSINQYKRRGIRVFALGNNSVSLTRDGDFNANLFHGVQRSGTFTETTLDDGTIVVTFNEDGQVADGIIDGNTLTIPMEWDDGHRHPRNFQLR